MAFVITGPIVCLTMKSLLLLLLLRGKLYTCMTWQKGLLAYLDDEPVASQYLHMVDSLAGFPVCNNFIRIFWWFAIVIPPVQTDTPFKRRFVWNRVWCLHGKRLLNFNPPCLPCTGWLSGSGDSELLGCSFHCESSSELSVPGDNGVPLEKIAFLLCETATNKNRDGDEQGVL